MFSSSLTTATEATMPDRSWEGGRHQLVEAKEGCPLTEASEQLGRLTYQRFFRRYLRLGGMTGTAREVTSELLSRKLTTAGIAHRVLNARQNGRLLAFSGHLE